MSGDLTDHDLLTALKLLVRNRSLQQVAIVLDVVEGRVARAVEEHGFPDRSRMEAAVDVVQQRVNAADRLEDRTPPKPTRPHPREHAAMAAGATLAADNPDTDPAPTVIMLPLPSLVGHTQNVRGDVGDVTELAASIQANGLLQPVTVTEHPTRTGKWLILAGHRRVAACNRVPGVTRVPAIVRPNAGHLAEHLVLMLVENHQRRQLTPLEKAEALAKLRDTGGLNQTQISRRTGIAVSTVNRLLALLELDDESLAQVRAGTITAGDAIAQVQKVRAAQRRTNGTPTRGRPVVAKTQHFTRLHPLADTVRAACDHTTVPKLGGVGCGPCWEHAIRSDALTTAGAT